MRKRLDQWRALSRGERRLLIGLAFLLPAIGVALRLLGFRRTARLLGGSAASAGSTSIRAEVGAEGRDVAMRLGQLVSIASRHGPYAATCLRQSLALCWLLRRRGLPAELRVGVGKNDGRVLAHAWVELAGKVINDRPVIATEYAAFPELDGRLPRAPG